MPIRQWSPEEQEQYIADQFEYHMQSKLPPCTPEDMWQKETTYAIKKEGNKKATVASYKDETGKKCDIVTMEHAERILVKMDKPNYIIVTREGGRTRCQQNWCGVANFCPHNIYRKEEL